MQDGSALASQLRRRLLWTGNLVNALGAGLVTAYFVLVFPPDYDDDWLSAPVALGVAGAYILGAALHARWSGTRMAAPAYAWLLRGGAPSRQERDVVLGLPSRFARMTLRHWATAAAVFTPLALATEGGAFGAEIATTILLTALTVSAAQYLVTERVMRPAVALALTHGEPDGDGRLTVGRRLLLAWLLCSALPVVMVALIPVGRDVGDPDDLLAPTWFVCAAALGAGLLATKLSAARVGTPLRILRRAVEAVGEGDLAARVAVDDASEIGRLQAGFNRMVDGLAERERLRDLMDRSVGRAVTAEALERGAALGGQVRDVSALFVDVIGSTKLAADAAPEDVVRELNRFFGIVVAVVEQHGGLVNKFEGDGALAIFGAPDEQPDHAARALATACDLRRELAAAGALDAGIGVATGPAVAGWVGAESRFEYTVIGDPVNEAARLTDLAKTRDGRVLATVAMAAGAPGWAPTGERVLLRGRDAPTALAAPLSDGSPSAPARRVRSAAPQPRR